MMNRSRIMTAALIAALIVTTGHSLTLSSLTRKGTIASATVEPTEPTSNHPVTLHVSTPDYLLLDRFDVKQIGKTFTVRVYWNEPAEGSTGSGPTEASTLLGTLAKGKYRVMIQSYCGRFLGGSATVSFEVTEADASLSIDTIDEIWVTPEAPTTSEIVSLHVSGHWPTAGYAQYVGATKLSGRAIDVSLYWTSPDGAAADVVTPYEYVTPLRLMLAGTYTVKVRVFLDERQVDTEEIDVDVVMGSGDGDGWPWGDWGLNL